MHSMATTKLGINPLALCYRAKMKILVMKTVSVLLIPLAILNPAIGGELSVRSMMSLIQ